MIDLTITRAGVPIQLKALEIGPDLCVIIAGGDSPHIGAVTLSVPRPSLADPKAVSASTSVLTRVGHKDDEAARYVSQELAAKLNRNVVVTCGIHVDGITRAQMDAVFQALAELVRALSEALTVPAGP
ncbi:hypothetical protein EDC14_10024 [Hydrogenispora ethanolica]|uniref:Prenylated flavin chaperone LpdD-like domain-containing protein n=1 Tax=Hydrogenispora ethanolica TaxID=1082276 RepID=A0A4R1S9Z5_HYDET|nr:proteasome assembly chaperone 4 family protein [Hydrogenispora ethanolica]TCL76251.1 hypothetical protein EDC14_10024 [Hydrogenispora ethanolica]